jgi:hypothetical protein
VTCSVDLVSAVNAAAATVAMGSHGPGFGAIKEAGGVLVKAYPGQVEGRGPQRGAELHTGPTNLSDEYGFERDREISKWRSVMRLRIQP